MTIARIAISAVILLLAIYLMCMNWGCVIVNRRNRKLGIDKWHSTVPLGSVLLAALAYFAYPLDPKWWIFMIPVLDVGTWQLAYLPAALMDSYKDDEPPSNSPEGTGDIGDV